MVTRSPRLAADRAPRRSAGRGRGEPRAVHPQQSRRRGEMDSPGQRAGDGARSNHAGDRRGVGGARQRQRRPRDSRRTRPTSGASGQAVLHAPPRLADQRRRRGVLLRLREPRVVALVSHCLYAAGVQHLRLGAVRTRQQQIRGGGARGNRGLARDHPRTGLSFRAAAKNRQDATARCHHQPLLAHPVASPRSLPHLPLAGGDSRRPARQRPSRISRAAALQQFSRDGRSPHRITRRLRALLGDAGSARDLRYVRSPSASTWRAFRRTATRGATCRRSGKSLGIRDEWAIALGVDRMDYTKGIPERLRAVDRFLERYPEWRNRFVFLQMGAPSRTEIREYRDLNDEVDRAGGAHQRQIRRRATGSLSAWRARTTRSRIFSRATARPTSASSRRCTTG